MSINLQPIRSRPAKSDFRIGSRAASQTACRPRTLYLPLLKVDAPRPPLAKRPQFPDQIGGGRHGGFVPFPDSRGAIRNCDAANHPGDNQLSSNARTTGPGPSVLMQIKAEFEVLTQTGCLQSTHVAAQLSLTS